MSGKQDWRTPPELFQLLDNEFDFEVDGAATKEDTLCDLHVSDAFSERSEHAWSPSCDSVFVNPPYANLDPWINLFCDWADIGKNLVVALLPAKCDTGWFALCCQTAHEIRLMKGRVQFIDPETGKPGANSNNAGSMIAIWRPGPRPSCAHIWLWDWRAMRTEASPSKLPEYDGWADTGWMHTVGHGRLDDD